MILTTMKYYREAPEELVVELSARYIHLYETITGENFKFPDTNQSIQDRLMKNLKSSYKEI